MSLRPGKKYLIKATKEKIAKRDQSNHGNVHGLPKFQYYEPKIDYVQDATADDIEPAYPASQFSTEYFEGQGGGKYDHDGIPFFGANRVVYDNLKYEEVYEEIENDEIYQISSSAQIKYDGVSYNHGVMFHVPNTATVTSFEVVKGSVLLLQVAYTIAQVDSGLSQPDFYFVYGTGAIAEEKGIKYNNKVYLPGDMFQGVDEADRYHVWNTATEVYDEYNSNYSDGSLYIPPALVIPLAVINNPSDQDQWGLFDTFMAPDSKVLVKERSYLVYGHTNAFYNGHSLRPEVLLRNIFKTGSDISFGWASNTTDRKFPLIREIAKSDSIGKGVEYYISSDRQLNSSVESHIKYDGFYLTTKTTGTEFAGKTGVSNYSVPAKDLDRTNDSKDIESVSDPFGADIERFSGNPFVIRKETIGLRKGQDYIIVPGEVSEPLTINDVYFVRGAGSIKNGDVVFKGGESFKATAIDFTVTGTASVFGLVNTVILVGVPSGTKVKIDGAAEVDYTSTLLSTSYDQRGLRFKITTCDYPLLYWDTSAGSPKVYPIVTALNNNSSIHVQANGDGSVLYPSKNLYYLCERLGLDPSDYGKKIKSVVDAALLEVDDPSYIEDSDVTACTTAGGAWIPQTIGHEQISRTYFDHNSFEAKGGSCTNSLYSRNETACEEHGETWTFDVSADVFDDSLFAYKTDTNYPFTVTTSASALVNATSLSVDSLAGPLAVDDCIVFSGAIFVVTDAASADATTITGRLLRNDLGSEVAGTVGIKPDTEIDPIVNPYEKYYIEDLEITYDPATPSEGDITVSSLPVDVNAEVLLRFRNSSGVCVAEFKVSKKANKGATFLYGSLRELVTISDGHIAKLPPSKVGTLAINKQYRNEERFRGVSGFDTIRAYNYKTLNDDNEEAHRNSYKNIAIYEVCTLAESLTNGEKFKVGGSGYIKHNDVIYHGEGTGKVVINHEKNAAGDLSDADTDELLRKGAHYNPAGIQTIGTRPLPSHIPEGTELVFPVGVFRLSENADKGDVSITGEILADYMENFIASAIWHRDESYYYKIERDEITGTGGAYSKVDKDGKVIVTDNVFLYKTQEPEGLTDYVNGPYDDMRLEWEDGEYTDTSNQRKVINITGSEEKEYYSRISPVEQSSGNLEENRNYQVKADGSFVEINNVLDNGDLKAKSSLAVGGHVYEEEAHRKILDTLPPRRESPNPEFIIYDRKVYIPGEVFEAVDGETHWAEATIEGTPQLVFGTTDVYKVPVAKLKAPIPVVPKLRTGDDIVWMPSTDLEGNELIPLFGTWDEEEKEWIDKDWFDEGNLTSEGEKFYLKPLKLKFGNGAVGEVLDVNASWGLGTEKYNSADNFYEKDCEAIFLKLVSGKFENGQVGKTGSGTANSGILYGGYAAGTDLTMKIKPLPHALPVGTELVFYPSHPYRQFRGEPEEQRLHKSREDLPVDWWSESREARRFTLTSQADAGSITITGDLLASYKSNVQTFAGVGFKTRAEIFREIIYNDKVVMAGESFTCKNDVRTLDHDTPTLITSWSNSESSLLDIVNSTKVEKVISFDDFVDYAKKEEIFSGSIFGFESKLTSVSRSDTSSAETGLRSGDVTGSQSRFGEIASSSLANANFYFFLPEFGLINTDTAALKIYKVEKIYERAHPNLFNNTAVLSYDSSDGNFKVGGKGNGYISYDSTTKGIGVTFNIASSDTVTFTPSGPVMYQEVPTGFEANKFYLVGAEDLADGASNDAPEVLYQKLVYPAGSTTERYYPFLRDRLPQFDTVNYELGQGGDEELQLHAPYLQSYIFGRDFAQFVENRLRGTLLDKIKISKLSNSGFAEDTAIINTGRFFSLINSTFMYYTILINKKFNGQWGGWEISEKAALAGPEKITDTLQNAPTKIRVFDGSDLSSSIEDMQYKIATSSDSYYTVNYPHLINIIEEKQPVLVNTMEDERLYFVEKGDITYAKYLGTDEVGFDRCEHGGTSDLFGEYSEGKFFYGKTDAWEQAGWPKLKTMNYLGAYNSEQASFAATGCFGNFDEYFIKPDEAAGGQFLVSTCYDPWEIEANRVYKVAGHDNDKIEYNGRIYDNGALITGKSLNSPNTLASDPISRTLMPVEEYQLRQAASPQPWMFSNGGVYSEEIGYKKLTPLLHKKQTGTVTLELDKRYVLYSSPDTTVTINSVEYNATDEMIPSNQFIGYDNKPSYSGTTVRQKFEDGQTLLPGVEYFVYGQGQITYPDSIVTTATASVGDSEEVSVVSVPSSIQVGQIFEFGNGAELIVKSWVVGEITGEVRSVGIESGASAPIIVNIFSSDVVKSAGDLGITGGDLAIVELPQDFFRGEVLVFSGGGVFVLSENAYAGDIVVKGDVIMGHIGSGEEAKIVDYKELKTKTITASGNFSTSGASNTFKGLKGFSRVGGKLGGAEILTAAASGSIKKNFLYKVFGSGSVTYNDIVYNGENVIYGDGNTYSISVSVREIIDPYDVKAGDVIYAYGAPTVNLFEYLDASEDIQYITENNGASTTWSADYSNLKVHKVPYTSNDFNSNQPTIASGRVYGIEPGVTYTIKSNDKLTNGDERRAVVKYAKDIGSCTKKDGTSIDSSKYHNKFDCTRRDVLVVDFGGPDYDAEGEAHSATTQYTDSDKVEHGDYRADGVKFRVTADFLAHYADNVVLKANDVLEFSKGGKFILSEDIDLDDLTSVAEEGETRYYGTMKGVIPFGYSLYHFEFCPVLNWSENFKDFYYTSDRTVVTQNTTNGVPERLYVGDGEIELTTDSAYRVEAGVEIVYDGVVKKIGDTFDGVAGVDSWIPSSRSNGFEYITRASKTDTEFVGVAGRPFLEIIEGNPKIFVKGEGPMDDGSYIVEGGSVIYSEDYEQSGGNITDSYFHDYCGDGPNILNEHFSKYLAGSYSAGVITAGAENSFMIGSFDSDAPYKNGCWLYDSTKIPGTLITVASPAPGDGDDLQLRNQYASPIGISEAQDYVDSTDHSDTWSVAESSTNCFLVTEGFLGFSLNKDTRNFPEVVEKGLPYKETGASTLFDLSDADGFEEFKQGGNYLTAVVFGAGDFGLHHYDTSVPTLHETTNYKAYGNLDTSSGAIEGKAVTSIEEDYMHKVETGTIKYRDKLLVIDNELGYCGVDAEGKQVVFHNYSYTDVDGSTTLHNRVLKTDSFKNDLYLGINVKRLGKLSGDLDTNDFLVFESEIEYTGGKTYAVGEGPSIVGEELSSRGIEIAPLPVGLIKGEILFFCSSINDAVTSITKGKFYCVRSGSYVHNNRVYGPYGFSRFFLCTGDENESQFTGEDVVEVSILELSHERNAGAGDLYGTISQSALEKGYKCIRQVSIKIDDLGLPASCKALTDWDDRDGDPPGSSKYADGTPIIIGEHDTKIWGRIADPLYYVAGTALYEDEIPHELYHKLIRRSLTNGQVLDRVIRYTDTTYHGLTATYTTDTPPVPATGIEDWERVYSEYTANQRFKGTQDTPSWRTVSGTPVIRYSNTINYATDLFWRGNLDVDGVPTATTTNLCGEYLSGQPKILFVLDKANSATIDDTATAFPVRYYYYDLDYGETSRSTLTLGSNTTEGSNNFFVGDGGENAITINDLLVKTVTGTVIKSSVLVGKVVVSGEIEEGKDYFVWGTGYIVYDGVETGAYSGSDIDSIKDKDSAYRFSGTDSRDWYTRDRSLANYEENPYIRKSWDRATEAYVGGSQIPKNKAKFYVARPMVFEIVTITDGVDYTTEAGAVYYVFGEGSITYINKQIFATNKYIAVATDTRHTSDNKIIPSGAISYGGKMIASYGDQYDLRNDFSFSPIPSVRVWTYAALLSNTGKRVPTLPDANGTGALPEELYVYRKVHGSEALTSGKKYYVFGRTDFISYKEETSEAGKYTTRQHFPRGQGREDIVVKGGSGEYPWLDDLTISSTNVTLDDSGPPDNNFADLEVGSEITVNWTVDGEVYYATRTIEMHTSDTDITVDSAFPAGLTSAPESERNINSTWQGRNPNGTSGKVTTAGTFTVSSAGVRPNRFLLGRAAILRQGYSCCIRTKRKRTVDGSGNPTTGFGEIERHGRISYKDIYGTTSSDKKIPLGTYVVRGRGEIIYPVFKFSSEPDEGDYAFVDGDSSTFNVNNIFKHKIYSKTFMAGDVFFAIELPVAIGLSATDGGDAPFYYKTTGQERVYRIPDDYKKAMEDNSMDQFLDMAPAKYGVNTGELLIGETYEVFYKDSEGNVLGKEEVRNLEKGDDIIAGSSGVYVTYQIGAGYGGSIHKSYRVGEKFTAIAVKDDGFCENPMISRKSACLAAGKNWRDGVKGGVRLVREFHAHKDLIVRAVEGIRKCAPAGAWSNEWSMFLTSTHHHPSRTSTWHHDYYGDVMGFLNQRCHIFSEDFKLGMYRHLLDTFSYGIKPVIRSEAPPGHIYLEGSNASQEWFYSDTDQEDLNRWFYSSCQIYKPDYYIESVTTVDYIEKLLSSTNVNDGKDPSEVKKFWNGICTKCQWQDDSECAFHNRADCELAGGTWVKAVDLVKVRLNRRLTHTPNTAFRSKDKKISSFTDKGMLALWHAMGAGPFTPEVYRTDENAVVDYLIREKHDTGMWRLKNHGESEQRKIAKQAVGETVVDGEPIDGYPKIREEDKLEFETADGKIVTNEKVQLPCHKARIGDAAPDIFIWQLPDDPFGACEPRFYFTKHIPYVHDDNRGIATKWTKTPVTVDPFIQMEQYLRGFCGGFVDKESDPKNEEITEVDIPTGTFDQVTKEEIFTKKSLDPTCYKSKDYDYLFENLSVQSLEGVGKTLFKDYSDVTIKKTRIVLVRREFDLPNPVINLRFTDVNSNSSKWDLISRSGARGYRIYRKTPFGVATAGTVNFKIVKLGNKWVLRFKRKFIDEYSIELTGSETVPYNAEYVVEAIDARSKKIKGTARAIYTGQADMLVLRDSQSKAVIKFTPSYCSNPEFKTKKSCEAAHPPLLLGSWSPVKYFLLERKRSMLPHYTEWIDHDLEIDVINQTLIQIKKNKRIKREDRTPSGQFEINDLNLRREEDSDPLYAGVSKDYEIKIFAYFRHLPKGSCISEGTFPSYEESELLAYSKGDCLLKAGTWRPNSVQTDNSTDNFEKSIKVPAYFKGMKNPFEVAKFLIRKDASGRYYIPTHDLNPLAGIVALSKQEAENLNNKYHAWVITDNEGVFKIRFRNLVVSAFAPIDSATRKEIPVLRNSKGYKVLFYDIKYRVKIGYDRDNLNESTTRRSPWEKVRRFSNASSGKEIIYHDNKNYKNENVNYRVTKVQTTNATSRWISPLMLEDELTGHPDSRKGYGPLPNIKLSAHVFNQFANAINLLNEARLDLPIRVKYRYHTKFVAQPSVIDPSGGLGVHAQLLVLNVPPPTLGTYSWRGHTCHPVSSPVQDRYEFMWNSDHGLGADPSSEADFVHTDAWGDESLGLSVLYQTCTGINLTGKSDWYFESGHSWFCADKRYGFLREPLLINDSSPFIAKGGMVSDTELKIAGNQLAFSYAVPDILRSRTNPDDLVLSGAMYETEIWTPELRRLPLSSWEAEDAGLDESQRPYACKFDDQTGSGTFARHFLWMSENREEDRFVKFIRKEKEYTFCKDISGTFIMKAPTLRDSWDGIIIAHHKTGSEYHNVCTAGGSQSSLCFSTRASSGDSNMRIKLPLKDKFGPWTQCRVTKPIKTKTKKTTRASSKEDEDTMAATASGVGPDSGRAQEYQVTLADGTVVDVPSNVEDLDYVLGDTGNALLPGKLERVEGRDKDGKLVFCEGTSCPPLEG